MSVNRQPQQPEEWNQPVGDARSAIINENAIILPIEPRSLLCIDDGREYVANYALAGFGPSRDDAGLNSGLDRWQDDGGPG
jgi:hypothetical protein